MRLIAQFARRKGLHHVIAISICALMLFFAVGSKVAWYHSKEVAAQSIASTKVWKAKPAAVDSELAGVNVTLQTAVELVALLTLCLVFAEAPLEREDSALHPFIESFAPLAMRPPPAF